MEVTIVFTLLEDTCHGLHMKVRGTLVEEDSLGLSRGPQRLGDKHILLLSHLAGTQISLMEVWDYSRVAFLRFHCT